MADNEKYIKGFNHGYYLKKHNPDLLKLILRSKSNNDYFKGLTDGSKQLEKQKTSNRLQELKKSKNINKGLDIDFNN